MIQLKNLLAFPDIYAMWQTKMIFHYYEKYGIRNNWQDLLPPYTAYNSKIF